MKYGAQMNVTSSKMERDVFAHPKLLRFAHSILLSPKCNVIIQV